MKQNSMRYQEVRNGEIITIITTTSILVLATTAATTTNPNKTDLRTSDKASSGDKDQKTPRSP